MKKSELTEYRPPSGYKEFFEKASKKLITFIGLTKMLDDIFHSLKLSRKKPILIVGETGVGKELIADLIHDSTAGETKLSLIKVNCGLLTSSDIAQSELFGHVRGAFTGAYRDREGRFREADGGTIFLDEVDALPQEVQNMLLRVIEERKITKLGDDIKYSKEMDVKVVIATNKRLLNQYSFRFDLYQRLRGYTIYVPPLRDRRTDLGALIKYFITEFNKEYNKQIKFIEFPILLFAALYPWYGNVRELKDFLEYYSQREDSEILRFDPWLNFFAEYELPVETLPQFAYAKLLGLHLNSVAVYFYSRLSKIEGERKEAVEKIVKIKGRYEDQFPGTAKESTQWFPHPALHYDPVNIDELFNDNFRNTFVKSILREEISEEEQNALKNYGDKLGKILELTQAVEKEITDEELKLQGDIFSLPYKEAKERFVKQYLMELLVKYGLNKKLVQKHSAMSADWIEENIKKLEISKQTNRQKSP